MRKADHITHVFRGKRYTVASKRLRKERGGCDDPSEPDKTMNVPYKGATLDNLSTIIHESLHACLWDIAEDSVEETGESIARFLWKLGWRKTRNKK